nr:hypothetical protein BaRGS_029891 [Batillaria attramentaria]
MASSHSNSLTMTLTTNNDTELSVITVTTENVTQEQKKYGEYGELEAYDLFWVAYYINAYYLIVIFVIGFPGNLLSFITILRMKPYSSPSLCVATLAVVDNLCLLVKLLLLQLTKNDVNLGVYGCKTLYYLGNAFAIFANWILVLMTIERFLAIWFPLKIGRLCTRRRSAISMVVLFFAVCALTVTYFITTTNIIDETGYSCGYRDEYKDFIELTWFLVDGAFYAIIPCALLIVFNSLIVWGISRAAVVQRSLTHDARSGSSKSLSNQAAEKVRQQRQITIMLLVVCVTFILLIMPNCVFFIYKGHWDHDDSVEERARYMFTNQLIFLLSDLTHAVNFFVYFISTKKFRDRFLDTVCFCKRWQRRQFARSWTTAQSQMSETGSIYVTSSTNGGVIPMSLRNGGKI